MDAHTEKVLIERGGEGRKERGKKGGVDRRERWDMHERERRKRYGEKKTKTKKLMFSGPNLISISPECSPELSHCSIVKKL